MEQKTAKKNKKNLFIFLGIALVVLVAGFFIFTFTGKAINNPSNSTLQIGDSAVLGEENAPVTIYEFSDFSCPFCQAAEGANQQVIDYLVSKYPSWEAPVPLIKEQYVQTGKVKIVYKYFPGHGAATTAHAVALGVKEQNPELFWKFAEKAYADPVEDLNDLGKMKAIAVSIGADETELSQYIASNKFIAELQAENDMGMANGVSGTPTFFINGQLVEGAQPFSVFKEIIDKELAK